MAAQYPGGPQPGWYPDPANPAVVRWWDGVAWTAHVGGYAQPVPPRPTPSGPTGTRYAAFWERLVAYLIDGCVLILPALVLYAIFLWGPFLDFLDSISFENDDTIYNGAFFALIARAVLISLILQATYYIVLIGRYGKTVGQRALSIRVVVRDGSVPGYGVATKRWLIPGGLGVLGAVPFIGSLASVVLLIDYLSMLWSDQKQCWHDMFAGTWVVHDTERVNPHM